MNFKIYKTYLILVPLIISLLSCHSNRKDGLKSSNQTMPTDQSIFNLTSQWHTQNNKTIELKSLRGKVLVIVLIYTSCKSACPRLVADMKDIESKIAHKKLDNINFVLVSIDPENDNPSRLKAFAITNKMDARHWVFLQGTKTSVQEFANVLAVKYKQISPMDFSHSNIISIFNVEGELIHQQEGLGVNNEETVKTIINTLEK